MIKSFDEIMLEKAHELCIELVPKLTDAQKHMLVRIYSPKDFTKSAEQVIYKTSYEECRSIYFQIQNTIRKNEA